MSWTSTSLTVSKLIVKELYVGNRQGLRSEQLWYWPSRNGQTNGLEYLQDKLRSLCDLVCMCASLPTHPRTEMSATWCCSKGFWSCSPPVPEWVASSTRSESAGLIRLLSLAPCDTDTVASAFQGRLPLTASTVIKPVEDTENGHHAFEVTGLLPYELTLPRLSVISMCTWNCVSIHHLWGHSVHLKMHWFTHFSKCISCTW